MENKKTAKTNAAKAKINAEKTETRSEIKKEKIFEKPIIEETPIETAEDYDPFFVHKVVLLVAIAAVLFFNQLQIGTATALLDISVPLSSSIGSGSSSVLTFSGGDVDLDDVDVTEIKSTAQGIAALFPVDEITSTDDAVAVMIPSGVPEYGDAMGGVSFDDPITALDKLYKAYPALKEMAKEDDTIWQRYLGLAAAPRGVACEFCCGIGTQGVTAAGELRCGCKHNPALQSVALWLMLNTDYSDAEVLKEVYKWKSVWFPKNMISLTLDIAGGDTSVLEDLPGMVGGC